MRQPTILALDGSTPTLSLAVMRGDECLAFEERGEGSHSILLPTLLEGLLGDAGLDVSELDGIAVGIGPGSFTGLRVILATAKGIAYGAKRPLHGISSLAAMAHGAARRLPEVETFVPVLDARKKEVYAGFYTAGGGSDEVVVSPQKLAEELAGGEGPIAVFGEGYRVYRELLAAATEGRRVEVEGLPLTPGAKEIGALASREDRAFSKEAVFALEPEYIRSSDAELGWLRPPKSP